MCTVVNKSTAWGLVVALWVFLAALIVWDSGCIRAPALAAATPAAVDVLAAPRAAVVTVARYCDNKADAWGTGLAVTKHDVVTVAHVVGCSKGKASFIVKFADGNSYPMTLAKVINVPNVIGKQSDGWARLTTMNATTFTEDVPEPTLSMPKVGEHICALNAVPVISTKCGKVSSHDGVTFAFTLGVVPGNSGSPLFDSNAKLIGFVVDCWPDGHGVCYDAGGDAVLSLGVIYL